MHHKLEQLRKDHGSEKAQGKRKEKKRAHGWGKKMLELGIAREEKEASV